MMRRMTAFFLLLFMIAGICACSDLPDVSEDPGSNNDISSSLGETTPAPTQRPTDAPVTEPSDYPTPTLTPEATQEITPSPAATLTIAPTRTPVTVSPTRKPTATKKPSPTPTGSAPALDSVVAAGPPAVSRVLKPVASGIVVHKGGTAAEPVVIDASNTANGYIMIRAVSNVRLKVIITGPSSIKYTYNLRGDDVWEVFQFSDGSGAYKVTVYREVTSGKYAAIASESMNVSLKDPNAPFLHPNQYVNFTDESLAVRQVAKICTENMKDIERIEAIYHYVITNFAYDYQKAATVKSGYIPDIDAVFKAKKGICFDYASLMSAMLRAYGIPTKLVVGYTGDEYHAWISTYTKESGWVEGAIFFNGTDWKLMDPTFASTANSSKEIMDYIAKTSNYTAKYIY